MIRVRKVFILKYNQGSHCQSECTVLVAALILLPKGDVEFIINESPDDPYPAHLEAVLGQQGPN